MLDNIEEDEVVIECSRCNDTIAEGDELCTEYGDLLCSDCSIICDRCNEVLNIDWSTFEIDGRDTWCESCSDEHAEYCASCYERHTGESHYVTDIDEYLCEDCVQHMEWCDSCCEWNRDGCEPCMESAGHRIHDYSYRPDPIFHGKPGDKLFFGIEIETEAPRNSYEALRIAAEYTYRLEDADLAYLKSDGSLECGFEIVTHPMTHDYYKNEASLLWDTIAYLRDEIKMRAWNTGTCGLHIHISRAGFTNGSHIHRFLKLIYGNEQFYARLAGRDSNRWAKFDDVKVYDNHTQSYHNSFKNKIKNGRDSDRYSAVNTQNRNTLEMRIFRGTVNGDTIKAAIDLAHASVEYTRNLTVSQVRDGALERMNFIQYIHDNKTTYPHLLTRLDKLFVASDSE